MYDALSVGGHSHQGTHFVILHGAGENFRRAGAVFIDQYHQRDFNGCFPFTAVLLFVSLFILCIDQKPLRHKALERIAHTRQQTARIIPQIHDQGGHPFFLKLLICLLKLLRRYPGKLIDGQITRLIFFHFPADRRDFHFRFGHLHLDLFICTLPVQAQRYGRFASGNLIGDLRQLHSFHRSFVYRRDHIARLHPRLAGRTAFIAVGHRDGSGIGVLDQHYADSLEVPFIALADLFIFFLCVIAGIGVIQSLQQAGIHTVGQCGVLLFKKILIIDDMTDFFYFLFCSRAVRSCFPRGVRDDSRAKLVSGRNCHCHSDTGCKICNMFSFPF